jgi:lysophospholipid acyltransferase (LPLAT)-like uncharacterized protein
MSDVASARLPLTRRLVARTGGALLGTLMRSLRYEVVTGEEHFRATVGGGVTSVVVLWHGRLLPSAYYYRHRGLATLISRHRDGDYIAAVVERWGFQAVRGSSSRGGSAALARIVELLEGGTTVAITPDGPRGPRQTMKSGPLRAAQRAGVPILPVTAATDRAWWVGGWDRFLIPKPFARIRMGFAEPMVVPREADAAEIARLEQVLQERLSGLTAALDGVA